MTSKERVLTACRHEQPDRAPRQIYLTPEIRAQLQAHFGGADILQALGIDLRGVNATWRGELRPGPGMPGKADSYDIWGAGYTTTQYRGGAYSEATELPFAAMERMEQVERYPWPSVDDYDFSEVRARAEALGEYAVGFGGAGIPDIVNGVSRARGMERVLTDIMLGDPVGVAIIDHRVEHYYEYCRRGLEAGGGAIDILHLGEDCGSQRGRLFRGSSTSSSCRASSRSSTWRTNTARWRCCTPAATPTRSCPPSSRWAWTSSTPCSPNPRAWTRRPSSASTATG